MTAKRVAAVYALCALAGVAISWLGFRNTEPRNGVGTMTEGEPVVISLPHIGSPRSVP